MKKANVLLISILFSMLALAQESQETIEMADAMRDNGKIYVVVAGLCIIFLGIVIYLVRIDRKISKLEKEMKK